MQYNMTTSFLVCLSENGFGLDELIYRLEDLANIKAFSELLQCVLHMVNENLLLKVMLNQALPKKCACSCEHPDLVLNSVKFS